MIGWLKSLVKDEGQRGINPFLILPHKPEKGRLLTEEQKKEWVRRLRSGQYSHGTGKLRDIYDRYCVLGVLCDTIDPTAWRPVKNHAGVDIFYSWNGQTAMISGDILPKAWQIELWFKNDQRKPFGELADWIEKSVTTRENAND